MPPLYPHYPFTRGTASKLHGIANFLGQGIYGRVGYSGLMAIKARQEEATAVVTPEIEACFEVIEAVMRFEPKRESSILLCSKIDFWRHQTLLSQLTTLDLVDSTSSFSNRTDLKLVSVLLRPIAKGFKPSGNQQKHTLRSLNFRWCCTPWSNGLTFFVSVKASGFWAMWVLWWPWWEGALEILT